MSFSNLSIIPSDCFTAQTIPGILNNGPVNPDIGGVAVGLANIAINILLSVLLKWSDYDVQTSVFMLLSQVYPILIATTASIGHASLSLFDAHFAIAVSASPVTVYVAYSAFRDFLQRPNVLFGQVKYAKNAIRCLGLFLPIVWFSLSVVISFSPTAFSNSDLCKRMSFSRWFEFQIASNFIGVLDVMGRRDLWNDLEGRGGLGAISIAALWVWGVYLVRHREDIYHEFNARRSEYGQTKFYVRWSLTIWQIPMTSWDVITISHPWMVLVIVLCLHWSWILGISRGMSFDRYKLSYGQVLSIFSVLPPLVAVCKLWLLRSHDLKLFMQCLPSAFGAGVLFFFTGRSNPWEPRALPQTSTFTQWAMFRRRLCVGLISLLVSGTDAIWIVNYVKAGSTPNPRTIVNDPHGDWKPFSVMLYVFGFFVSCINVLIWSTYYDMAAKWPRRLKTFPSHHAYIPVLLVFWFVHMTIVVPIACFMCIGPLFSPFAALPLAQQRQWSHRCDPFLGEAVLEGRTYLSQPSLASLYYSQLGDGIRTKYFEYAITRRSEDPNVWTFDFAGVSAEVPAKLYPFVQTISYDLNRNTIGAECMTGRDSTINTTATEPCMWGTINRSSYLTFFMNDTRTNTATILRAVDREWAFTDDAPSFILRTVESDGQLGGIAIQTAVTKRNHCDLLKICLSSERPGFDMLAPLGLALWAQDHYASYCNRPRIYSY